MISPVHIAETALIFFVACLLGCSLGYAIRRILYAARGTHLPKVVAVVPASQPEPVSQPVRRSSTPAARLAASASDEPLPSSAAIVAVQSAGPSPKRKREPADPRPLALVEPRGGRADNLKQIKGIGPKIEASLNAMGIYHIDQIAGWTKANVEWVDGQLAFKGRIRREQWVEQAIAWSKGRASAA